MDVKYDIKLNCLMSDEALEEFVTLVSVKEYEAFFKHLTWLDDRSSDAALLLGDSYFDRGCDMSLANVVDYLREYLTYFRECRASKHIEKLLDRIEPNVKESTFGAHLKA